MKKYLYLLVFAVLAFGCNSKKEVQDEKPVPEEQQAAPELLKGFTLEGDSIVLPPFEITIDLSQKAEKKLASDKETIIVQAYLSGTPKENVKSDLVNEMGEINLASPRVELKAPGTARFEGVRISKNTYALLKDKDFEVLINVFSGRHSTDQNLLTCDILQEPVTVVNGKKHVLKGKLIGE